jgi:hypothetical protein
MSWQRDAGRYEQWSTIGAEKLHRALLLVQMVLLGTIAVLLFPFGQAHLDLLVHALLAVDRSRTGDVTWRQACCCGS